MEKALDIEAFSRDVGARLRAARKQSGFSLGGLQRKSGGHWKASTVGMYERGDRSITVERLAELAAMYGVPVASLLPGNVYIRPRER